MSTPEHHYDPYPRLAPIYDTMARTLLLPFGWVFSGPKTIWVALLLTYYMAKTLSAHCIVPAVGSHELFPAFHTALYYAGMNLGLIFTIVGKKVFGRERPENRENKRLANLRKI